uniref:EGF-like domain-containing protein n=1 Tax=Minutocellus polymorphus TaxID=265543 RepID=A0A6U0IAA2_9STRA|mmetsp:Transcript_10107/g.16714  ORF Transcript_10107/g.16714 Transcript_10107/m.16714 type:complete len:236 (+) Transcript_10107:156-863(+)
MTSSKRTLFLAVAAAVALTSLGEGVAASSTSNVASPLAHRGLQNNDVVTVCPDGSRCTRGRRCYKTGREDEKTGLEEYGCGDCVDIDDNNGRCEFAEEVFCVVGDDADTSNWFCVNEGRCINDQVGSIDRARCQCASRYEGPNCQLRKSANSITEEDAATNGEPNEGIRSETGSGGRSLSIGAIVGIAVGGFVALVGLLLLLGRRKGRGEDHNGSVIDSVENSHEFQHSDNHEYA